MREPDARFEPVARLSRRLLRQIADFGLFSINQDPLTYASTSGFDPRIDLLLFLLEAFNETDDCGLSVVYNLSDWTDDTPIAHHPPRPCEIASKRIAQSLVETWELDWKHPGHPSAFRFTRGALYFWNCEGMGAAVSFLFGLAGSGFMTHGANFSDCLHLLYCAIGSSDDDFMASLYGGDIPTENVQWRTRRPQWPESLTTAPGLVAREFLGEVATQAVDLTDKARDAKSYDEWLRVQYQLHVVLPGVVQFLVAHVAALPTAWRAVADQLEEIHADAFAVVHGSRRNIHGWLVGQWATMGGAIAGPIAAAVGQGWRERYVDERALLPRPFAAAVLGPEGDPEPFSPAKLHALPDEAMVLSPAVGAALVAANGFGSETLTLSRPAATRGEATAKDDLADLEQSLALKTNGQPELALEAESRAIALHPWSALHHFRRAETLLILRRAPEALTAIEEALLVEPGVPAFWTLYAHVLFAMDKNEAGAFAQLIAARLEGPANA